MTNNTKFEYFIVAVIIVSCIQLALENPLNDPNGNLEFVISYVDIICTSYSDWR